MFDIQNSVLVKYSGSERDVVIPEGVTEIGEDAFGKCDTLESVVIPEGVTRISKNAFSYCKALKSVSLPQSLREIGHYAFQMCVNLKEVEIPKNVVRVEESSFADCHGLSVVTWNATACEYAGDSYDDDSTDMRIDLRPFPHCSNLQHVIIGDDVVSVPPYAFFGCSRLECVTVGKSVTEIGEEAFSCAVHVKKVYYTGRVEDWCNIQFDYKSSPIGKNTELYIDGKVLRELTLPESAKEVCSKAFSDYNSLRKISLPGCEQIGRSAFYQCMELKCVTLSSALKKVDLNAFGYSPNIKKVYFDGDLEQWCDIDFMDEKSNPLTPNAEFYVRGKRVRIIRIPKSVTKIKDYAFSGGKFSCAIIHDGVEQIGYGAFAEPRRRCVKLEEDKYGHIQNKVNILPCGESVGAIFFEGDRSAWQKISVGGDNDAISRGKVYMLSKEKPTSDGMFWHYAKDGVTPVIWK